MNVPEILVPWIFYVVDNEAVIIIIISILFVIMYLTIKFKKRVNR